MKSRSPLGENPHETPSFQRNTLTREPPACFHCKYVVLPSVCAHLDFISDREKQLASVTEIYKINTQMTHFWSRCSKHSEFPFALKQPYELNLTLIIENGVFKQDNYYSNTCLGFVAETTLAVREQITSHWIHKYFQLGIFLEISFGICRLCCPWALEPALMADVFKSEDLQRDGGLSSSVDRVLSPDPHSRTTLQQKRVFFVSVQTETLKTRSCCYTLTQEKRPER